MPRPSIPAFAPAFAAAALLTPPAAGFWLSDLPAHAAPYDLEETTLHLKPRPAEHRLVLRAVLRGRTRAPLTRVPLALYPALAVTAAHDAHGPIETGRRGEALDLYFPGGLGAGERFRVVLDLAGRLFDPARGPGPHRDRPPSTGIRPHLDPASGLVLPRESYWYPRPPWADPQTVSLQVELPGSWRVVARMRPRHAVPLRDGRTLHRLDTEGPAPRPLGLAAGPYETEVIRRHDLRVRLHAYPLGLAEQPDPLRDRAPAVRDILGFLMREFGPPGAGGFDVVELAGAAVRDGPSTYLGQGSFAWIQAPRGRVRPEEVFWLSRDLARAWWGRAVRMAAPERAGIIHFVALLAVRELLGEAEFLAGCRRVAAGAKTRPGRHLVPFEPEEYRVAPRAPPNAVAAQQRCMLLLGYLQRLGAPVVYEALAEFTATYRDRRAGFPELVELLDAREGARAGYPGSRRAEPGGTGD